MVRLFSLITTLILPLLASPLVRAEVLFEGYSKITSGGVHIGYNVSRYGYDAKTKHFTAAYLTKTGSLGSDITETLKAEADQDFNPIAYEYVSIVGKKTKTIDAKFSKGKMTAVVTEDGQAKPKTITADIKKGTFLSTFLVYLILKSKEGLHVGGPPFTYTAVAEEDGRIVPDTKNKVLVEKEETYNGQHAFRIMNKFDDIKFTAYVTDRGETLATVSPANGVATELVAKPSDATGNFSVSTSIMKHVFGDVPLGTDNSLSRAAKEEALPSGTIPGKQGGVPGGKGIIVKPEAPKAAAPTEAKGKGK